MPADYFRFPRHPVFGSDCVSESTFGGAAQRARCRCNSHARISLIEKIHDISGNLSTRPVAYQCLNSPDGVVDLGVDFGCKKMVSPKAHPPYPTPSEAFARRQISARPTGILATPPLSHDPKARRSTSTPRRRRRYDTRRHGAPTRRPCAPTRTAQRSTTERGDDGASVPTRARGHHGLSRAARETTTCPALGPDEFFEGEPRTSKRVEENNDRGRTRSNIVDGVPGDRATEARDVPPARWQISAGGSPRK